MADAIRQAPKLRRRKDGSGEGRNRSRVGDSDPPIGALAIRLRSLAHPASGRRLYNEP